jgi:hypothetical protein
MVFTSQRRRATAGVGVTTGQGGVGTTASKRRTLTREEGTLGTGVSRAVGVAAPTAARALTEAAVRVLSPQRTGGAASPSTTPHTYVIGNTYPIYGDQS